MHQCHMVMITNCIEIESDDALAVMHFMQGVDVYVPKEECVIGPNTTHTHTHQLLDHAPSISLSSVSGDSKTTPLHLAVSLCLQI